MSELVRQRVSAVFSTVLLVLVLSPVTENFRAEAIDSFPLSYYPMFTADRGQHEPVTYLVGVDRDGVERTLTYRLAGSGGLNQVRKQIRSMVRQRRAGELCAMVAGRAAGLKGARYNSLRAVRIVSGTYDFRDYFSGNTTPVTLVQHATCRIEERD